MIPEGQYIDVQDGFRFHYYDEGEGEVETRKATRVTTWTRTD